MWLATRFGYFSIVLKPSEKHLTIRSRVRNDLENLRKRYLPKLKIIEGAGTDYPYRAEVSHKDLGKAMKQIVFDIDYPNHKEVVAKEQGLHRSKVYGRVWSILTILEREESRETGVREEDSDWLLF